jgi:hypothetical protein
MQAVDIPGLEDCSGKAGVTLPRLVKSDHHLARHWAMEDPLCTAFETVHQEIVEEQFAPVAD